MPWNKEKLVTAFDKVGLTLKFAPQSFARGTNADDIFGLDIRRAQANRADTEFFLMWPGHEDNNIVIRDSNKEFGQILLTVTEAEREYEEQTPDYSVARSLERAKDDAAKALLELVGVTHAGYPRVKTWQPKKNKLVLVRKTPKGSRTFLIGRDERQLFMTQINTTCTTVKAAHDSLKTPTVTFFEGKAGGKTIRQGEWFFINLPEDELAALEASIKSKKVSVLKKRAIGMHAGRTGGKPHTADELVAATITVPVKGAKRSDPSWAQHVVHPAIVEAHGPNEAGLAIMLANNGITKANVVEWNPGTRRLVVMLPIKNRGMAVSPRAVGRPDIYVRGAVKHKDHATVKFSQWRKVIGNTETEASRSTTGGSWID